jgi:1-acyl-sn-glycerol-3-phosphate acyltransferase
MAVRVRKLEQKRGWAIGVAASILKPTLLSATSRTWIDGEKIPATGGCIVVINHISHVDPLLSAHFVYDHGRLPRYLAKAALFDVRFVGGVLRRTGQIPVHRLTSDAASAFGSAVEAIGKGQVVIVYPEGTITREPGLWPMVGKTGAARIALAADCEVYPVAQWGAQDLLAPYAKKPRLLPPASIRMKAGDPVDLDDLRGQPPSPAVLREATERIMAAITALLEDVRGEKAPAERFDPRKAGVREIGNPYADAQADRRRRPGRSGRSGRPGRPGRRRRAGGRDQRTGQGEASGGRP